MSRALLLGLAIALAPGGGWGEQAPDPWRALERLRQELSAAGPLSAEFVQTFTPGGFTSGETESGRLAAALPDCLRWDYLEPYRKSFLVCGSHAWSWVEGEPRGQRVKIDAREETGLDLLLLTTAELSRRYRAIASSRAGADVELALEPLDERAALAAANLGTSAGGTRPATLDYRDREGSVTSFRFSNWRPLAETDLFSPPAGIEWSEP